MKERIRAVLYSGDRFYVLFALYTLLAALCGILAHFYPPLDLTLTNCILGASFGMTIVLVFGALKQLAKRHSITLSPPGIESKEIPAQILTAATAEEVLLRGFLFGMLLESSIPLAFLINFAASFSLYYRGSSKLWWTAWKALEGTLLAALFSWRLSLFATVLARTLTESLILREKYFGNLYNILSRRALKQLRNRKDESAKTFQNISQTY